MAVSEDEAERRFWRWVRRYNKATARSRWGVFHGRRGERAQWDAFDGYRSGLLSLSELALALS